MRKNNLRRKLDDSDHNAEIPVTDYECFREERVAKNNEYLSRLGLTNRSIVNPLSSILLI